MTTSVMASKNAMTGWAFSRLMSVRAMPTRREAKTTWSMLPAAMASKGFFGTMLRTVSQTSGFWAAAMLASALA